MGAIYWDEKHLRWQRWRRRIEPALIGIGAALFSWWSPVWLLPTRAGIMLTLTGYMVIAYAGLWLALRRLDLKNRRNGDAPFFLLFLVTLYLGTVALALTPMMTALSSSNYACQRQSIDGNTHHVCSGHYASGNLDWQFTGRVHDGLPLIWLTERDFEAKSP